jgi:hypothetical protein
MVKVKVPFRDLGFTVTFTISKVPLSFVTRAVVPE